MKNNKPLGNLLGLTKTKGFSTPLRREIMTTLNGSEEEKLSQIEQFSKIVQESKTEEEAIEKVRQTAKK